MPDNQKREDVDILCTKDYLVSKEEFCLILNSEYGYLETHPQPLDNLSDYYESEEYISHTDSNKGWFEKLYQFVKTFNIRYKFSLIGKISENSSLLDYGCGTGDFLKYAQNKKLKVFGIEPNEKALKITKNKIGKENAENINLNKIKKSFDIITLWHVLEHIPNLQEFINSLNNRLKDNGKILIAVPNYQSYDAKFYHKYWAGYDVPRHLWHFSPESLKKLMEDSGFKVEKKSPLWFDSYYVSLLSEKYKNSKLGFIRAVFIATASNIKAIFTGNYSSFVLLITKNTK